MFGYADAYPDDLEPRELSDLPLAADRVCTYTVGPGDPADKAQGELIAARFLDDPERAAIDAALAESVEDPGCARVGHTKFAVLWADATDKIVYVALDGCAVQLDGSWWRATDELRALLD